MALSLRARPLARQPRRTFNSKRGFTIFWPDRSFKARNSTRFTPFVHVLGGVAHTSANFTTPGPTLNILLKKNANSFAMAVGGGLDIRARKRLSFRALMDYNPVFVHDSTSGTRDLFRLSLGVLFH